MVNINRMKKKLIKAIDKYIPRDMMYPVTRGIMDAQLKRGVLDVCVLTAIKNEDSYGYKIIKDLRPVLELSESTLYTILKRLEEAGMLIVRSTEYEGRLRKYYHITEAGLQRVEDFKNEWKELMDIYLFIEREGQ